MLCLNVTRMLWLTASLLAISTSSTAAASAERVDAKGSHDHALIQRFKGSWLTGYKFSEWEQATFPTSMVVKDGKWADALVVEGRVTKAIYVSPVGKSPLEVFRNYEQALGAAGFQRRFSCEN